MRRKKLERWLREHGARFDRHGSRHDIWRNEQGQEATIPRHKEINTHTARHICEQLGAPEPRER
jgi:predicted RNA binding protein YcfA (HicA-like mRNA interferase family)